jgi:hypothetical protein
MNRCAWTAAALAVIPGLLVAACGGGGTTTPGASTSAGTHTSASAETNVAALRSQMVESVKQARSVHVNGSISQGTQRTAVDAVLTKAGGVGGTLSLQGHSIAVRASRGHVYILVSRSMSRWQKFPPRACALMCGKWLKEPASGLGALAGDAGWRKLVLPFSLAVAHLPLSYGGKATVNGQPALKLNAVGLGAVYVAAQGTPYPLRIQLRSNLIVYSDWNTAKLPPPPPASKVVTTGQLATGG